MSLILDQKFKIIFGYTGVAGQPELHESLSKNKKKKITNLSTSYFKKRKNKSFNYESHKVIEKFVLLIQWKIERSPFL